MKSNLKYLILFSTVSLLVIGIVLTIRQENLTQEKKEEKELINPINLNNDGLENEMFKLFSTDTNIRVGEELNFQFTNKKNTNYILNPSLEVKLNDGRWQRNWYEICGCNLECENFEIEFKPNEMKNLKFKPIICLSDGSSKNLTSGEYRIVVDSNVIDNNLNSISLNFVISE